MFPALIVDTGTTDAGAPRGGGVRTEMVRRHNLALLAAAAVTSVDPRCRADLAQATGLNRSTVTRLIEHLITHGILVERGTRSQGSGRPSVPLHPAPHTHVAIGAEITSDAFEVCVVDLTGAILSEHYEELPQSRRGSESVLDHVGATFARLAQQIKAAQMNLVGIACGIPGLLNRAQGKLLAAPNLGWWDVDVLSQVRPHVAPDVSLVFDNSATLAAFAERMARRRSDRPIDDFVYVTGSTGLGSALVRNGEIVTGSRGWAGELGHIVVTDSHAPCSCGATGCLETVVGRQALLTAAGLDARTPVGKLFAALHRNDRRALQAVHNAGVHLGRGLAAYLNLCDSPAVVLGGLLEQLFPHIEEPLRRELASRQLSSRWAPTEISRAIAGPHAVSVGAGWRVLLSFLNDPDRWREPAPEALAYYSVTETPETVIT